MKKKLMLFVLGVVIGCSIVGTHHLSIEDAVREESAYCAMVLAGDWPNYKGVDCDGYRERKAV